MTPRMKQKQTLTNPDELDFLVLQQLRIADHNLVLQIVEMVADLPMPIGGQQEIVFFPGLPEDCHFHCFWEHHFVFLAVANFPESLSNALFVNQNLNFYQRKYLLYRADLGTVLSGYQHFDHTFQNNRA